jgi:hypothetical protein
MTLDGLELRDASGSTVDTVHFDDDNDDAVTRLTKVFGEQPAKIDGGQRGTAWGVTPELQWGSS